MGNFINTLTVLFYMPAGVAIVYYRLVNEQLEVSQHDLASNL